MMSQKQQEIENANKLSALIAIKKTLFGFNYFIWAAGCTAACFGIWFRVERNITTLIHRIEESDITLTSANIYLGANILISIGAIIAFGAILGSLSITKENYIMIFVYAFILFSTFALYATCAGWGFHRLDFMKGIVSDAMRELFNKAQIEQLSTAKYAVNEIQQQLQCCGNVGPSEYAGDIPPSCSSYVIGCNQAFYDFFRRNILILAIMAIVFGFIQLFAIGLALYFGYEVRVAKGIIKERESDEEASKRLVPN